MTNLSRVDAKSRALSARAKSNAKTDEKERRTVSNGRLPYDKAMLVGRDVIERVLQWRDLTEGDASSVLVLVAQMSCFSKVTDSFTHERLAELAGKNPKTIAAALNKLADRECIDYTPGTWNKAASSITLLPSDPLLVGESRFAALESEHTTPRSKWLDACIAYREVVAAYFAAPSARAKGKHRNAASADTRLLLVLGAHIACSSRVEASFTHERLAELAGVNPRTVRRRMRELADRGIVAYTPGTRADSPSLIALSIAPALDVPLSPRTRGTKTAHEGDKNRARGGQKPRTRGTSRAAIPEYFRVAPTVSELKEFQPVANCERDDDYDEPLSANEIDFVALRSKLSSATATAPSREALTAARRAPQSTARTVADVLSPEAKQRIAKRQYAAQLANGYRPRTLAGRATPAPPMVASFTLDISELDGLAVLAS